MLKKLTLLFAIATIAAFTLQAQTIVKYNYDNAGNRIYRGIIVMETTLKKGTIDTDSSEYKQKILEEKLGDVTVRIYPNPTKGIIKVEIPEYKPEFKGLAALYSLKGKLLQTKVFDSSEITLDLTSYPLGTYVLKINLGDRESEWKILKQ